MAEIHSKQEEKYRKGNILIKMDADSMQRKLDCYLLTARISKERAKEIKSLRKVSLNTELSKETLAGILKIKRTEDRILTRLDYWIHGQLSNESDNERQTGQETSLGDVQAQTWDFNIHSSQRSLSTENVNYTGVKPRADRLVARSLSVAQSKSAKKAQKDRISKSGKTQEKAESISMFNYNAKTDFNDDDNVSTAGMLRRRMFSKFGTLNRRKLKMFFTRGNDENDDDRKSMKSFKSVKSSKEGKERRDSTETTISKIPSALRKFKKRNGRKEDTEDLGQIRQTRPKSVASFDLDYENLPDQIADAAYGSNVDIDNNVRSSDVSKRKTLRERLRTMPVFYIPSSNKGQLKVYK